MLPLLRGLLSCMYKEGICDLTFVNQASVGIYDGLAHGLKLPA